MVSWIRFGTQGGWNSIVTEQRTAPASVRLSTKLKRQMDSYAPVNLSGTSIDANFYPLIEREDHAAFYRSHEILKSLPSGMKLNRLIEDLQLEGREVEELQVRHLYDLRLSAFKAAQHFYREVRRRG